ncbi:MAG: signal recognition particle-docking protein FtsY [Candidatus ainarchaeum sp.]|nr:signal recognition particle-docking protein FtsY [Candidatus ainarchaeum sp.]
MFELLKKKISSFADKFKQKVEKKAEEPKAKQAEESIIGEKPAEKTVPEKPFLEKEKSLSEEEKIWKEAEEEVLSEEKAFQLPEEEKPIEIEQPEPERKELEIEKEETEKPLKIEEKKPFFGIPKIFEKKRELKAKIGIGDKIKRALRAEITIEEKDLEELLEELELSFLEADVEQETAEEIAREMRKRISGKKISASIGIDEAIKKEIREILLEIMKTEQVDLLEMAKEKKPFKILFLGPNGAGKTTSIAKLTKFFENNGLKCIWSASDTFRAASIEQLEKHAEKLGVRVVKHTYGADPAAVAFDAIKAAEAKKIDVVLIDSAGRQETNKNLMEELKKIVRVAKPDLKIYVGESFTGQALLQQAEEYNKAIGIDGFILTKIDCDAKGGTTISLLYKIKKPILFVGTGQEYKDLEKFDPKFVLDKIL